MISRTLSGVISRPSGWIYAPVSDNHSFVGTLDAYKPPNSPEWSSKLNRTLEEKQEWSLELEENQVCLFRTILYLSRKIRFRYKSWYIHIFYLNTVLFFTHSAGRALLCPYTTNNTSHICLSVASLIEFIEMDGFHVSFDGLLVVLNCYCQHATDAIRFTKLLQTNNYSQYNSVV